jgi:hypothetical protein
MQYKVITVTAVFSGSKALEKLTKEVNEAIALGWEPVGGIAFANACLLQAMIKRR